MFNSNLRTLSVPCLLALGLAACGGGGGSTTVNTPTPQPGTISLSSATYTVGEGDGNAVISLSRSGGSSGAVSVQFATSDGTASAGADYTATSATVNWAAGDASPKMVSVPILDDSTFEPSETLTVTISAASGGATLGTPSTATVTITENDPAPLTFEGATSELLGMGAGIELTIGDQTYTGTAGTNGIYSIDASGFADEDFVSLRATGVGANSSVRLESLLGTAGALRTAAGDGTLTLGEASGLLITGYTTAVTGLVATLSSGSVAKAENPNAPVQTDAALAEAMAQIDPNQAINVAAAIKIVADGHALPNGVTDTSALARSGGTRDQFIEDLIVEDSETFNAAANAVAEEQSSNQTLPPAASGPLVVYFASPNFLLSANGYQFALATDGTGTLNTLESTDDLSGNTAAFHWTQDSGPIVITLDAPRTFDGTTFIDCDENGTQDEATVRSTTLGFTLKPLSGDDRRKSGRMELRGESQILTCNGTEVDREPVTETTPYVGTFVFAPGLLPYTQAEIGGSKQIMQVYDPDRQAQSGNPFPKLLDDLLDFNTDGSGSALVTGFAFTWSVDAGVLKIAYTDTGVNSEYRRLVPLGDGTQFNTSSIHIASGGRITTAGIAYTVDQALEDPLDEDVPGIFHQFGVGTEGAVGEINEFQIRLYDTHGGEYYNRFSYEDDNGDTQIAVITTPVRWSLGTEGLDEGAIIVEVAVDTAVEGFPAGCDPTASSSCVVVDRRKINVFSVVNDSRVFVTERRQINRGEFDTVDDAPVGYFSRFYDDTGVQTNTKSAAGSQRSTWQNLTAQGWAR